MLALTTGKQTLHPIKETLYNESNQIKENKLLKHGPKPVNITNNLPLAFFHLPFIQRR